MNPVGNLLSLFLLTRSFRILGVLTLVGTALASYEVYLAALSPEPPLKGTSIGESLVVRIWFSLERHLVM